MKKIYLLLVAVMVTLSSFAAPKLDFSSKNLQLKDGALEQMQQAKFDFDQKIKEGKVEPMRSWTDKDGVVWNAALVNQGGAWEMFTIGGEPITPADLPIYVVSLKVYDNTGKNDYRFELAWPTQLLWYETEEEAIATLGEENIYNFTPFDWVLEQTFEYNPENPMPALGIMDPQYFGTTCMYNGDDSYVVGSGMTLTFTTYDKDLNWLDFSLAGPLEGNATRYIAVNYSGDAYIYGIEDGVKIFYNPGQVHIFNTGVMDSLSDWAAIYYSDFDPVTRYYLMFAAEGFGYSDENGMPLELTYSDGTVAGTSFSATELPKDNIPYQIAEETDVFHCGFGSLFASEDSQKPYGVWTLPKDFEYNEDYFIMNAPTAYELLPGGYYNDISVQDGMHIVDENFYYHNPKTGMAEFIIGDVNEGMRFTYVDKYGCDCLIQYKGDIFFHNNPEDYTDVEKLPALGDQELVSVEKVETEKINVKVVGNSIVAPEGAEIYNLNGVRVNANDLENGLYIVKVGKNAVKVVL